MDLLNQKILVLSVDHYEVTDDTTGRVSSGTSCWYYANPELKVIDGGRDSRGMKPAKMALPENFLSINKDFEVPCLASVDFVMRPDSKGKMQLTATNFTPIFGSIKLVFGDAASAAKPAASKS